MRLRTKQYTFMPSLVRYSNWYYYAGLTTDDPSAHFNLSAQGLSVYATSHHQPYLRAQFKPNATSLHHPFGTHDLTTYVTSHHQPYNTSAHDLIAYTTPHCQPYGTSHHQSFGTHKLTDSRT
mmetsp:Transcript_11830/g.23564  ORF Transcript_11830/g.23564 Transcript_11830/m.23564 type:complete len:122 (-) Transcript_11830:31-396(-)